MKQVENDGKAYELAARIMERFTHPVPRHSSGAKWLDGINFWSLEGIESTDVMRILGNHPREWMPLYNMVGSLREPSKYDFWRTVFENRDVIPRDELMRVWHTCLTNYGKWWVDTPNMETDTPQLINNYSSQELAESVVTNPLLIDHWIVRNCYIMAHKPGWRFIRCIEGWDARKPTFSNMVKAAVEADDVSLFIIRRDMEGFRASIPLILNVLAGGRVNILRHLVEKGIIPRNVMTLEELCCFCTAQFPDHQSIPLLTAIEEARPGILKSVRDDFGRNLLWYAVHNQRTGWFHPNCKLTPFLIKKGCDPENRNQIGLSWREVTDGLTIKQKTSFMKHRHRYSYHPIWWLARQYPINWGAPPLYVTQSLEDLKKSVLILA